MSISRQVDEEAVLYIHNGILLGHEKECIWVSSNEVDETGAYYIQSEVSQKDKHQCNILMHTYGIQKDGNDDPICKTARETQM